ncbi:MAG: hypothetical protein K0S33_1889 [Bacteroidetes bacterium]|jgi:hypothetical protein|nr:hypothetical protein [Bacteroidota bacterium]
MKKHTLFNFLFLLLFSASSFGSVKLIMGNYNAAPGSQVTVPVKVKDFLNIVSAQGTIQFNQTITSFVSVQNFGLPGMNASNFGTSQTSSGKLIFSWFDGTLAGVSLPDSATLFMIKFNVIGTAGQVSALNFINSPTPLEMNDNAFNTLPLVLQNGSVTVQSAAPSNNVILKIDTISGTQGSQVLVSVRGVDFTNINSFQGTIQFNPSIATYAGIATYGLPGMTSSNFGTAQIASGKLSFTWFDGTLTGQSMANNAPLFTMKFNLTGSPGSQTILNFASGPTPLEVTDSLLNVLPTTTVDGKIKITGTPSAQTLRLRIDSVAGPTSSQVVVPVRVWEFRSIMSLQGTISFNTPVATFVGTEQYGLSGLSAGNFGTSQVSSGKLMFSWADGTLAGQTLSDSSVVFAIRFNVVGLPGDITPLTFINAPTPVEVIDSTFNTLSAILEPGRIRVSGSVSITTDNPASTVFCGGDSVSIGYTAIGGFNAGNNFILQLSDATGSFVSPTIVATISSTAMSGTFHAIIPISMISGTGYRFRVVSTNSAITGTDNGTNITINQLPANPSLPTGNTTLCTNPANSTYTISPVPGAASYAWTLIPAAAGTVTPSGTSALVDWDNTFTGNVQLFVSAANGSCQSGNSDSLDITIFATPATPAKPLGDSSLCASSASSVYTITAVSGAVSYQWQLTPAAAGTITGTGTSATVNWNGAFSGTASISVAGVNPSCTGSYSVIRAITILLSPVTPVLLSGNLSLCLNPSNTTYTISSDVNATSHIWSLSTPGAGVITPSGTSASIDWNNSFTGTTYLIFTATNGTCSATDSVSVVINTLPAVPGSISGLTTLCSGTTTTYSVTNDPAATGYTWTLPGGWSGTSTTNSISATAGTSSGNVSVIANNSCGSTIAQTLAVTVNTIPSTPGTISGATTICSGSSNAYSITAVSGATGYTWTLPGGWTGTSTTNSINITADNTSGTISVTAGNSCGNSTAQSVAVVVNTIPASPAVIAGPSSICEGNSATWSVTAVPGATDYTWTLPGGWSGTSTTNSITATGSTNSGNISVTANNSCGNSAAQTLAVAVDLLPASAGAISGTTTICSGSTNTYSISPVAGATSYSWTLPGFWSGTSTTNSITTTASGTSGPVSVAVNNSCGSSAPQTLAVIVNTIPVSPGTIAGTTTICSGSSNIYSIADVPDATSYTWTLPGGWSGTSATDSITTIASDTSGTITVTANNSCGSSIAQTLAIVVNTIPAIPVITGPAAICAGNNVIYSVTDVPGATDYTWTLPGGWPGTSVTDSITTIASSSGGSVSVTANNACGNSIAQNLTITIDNLPSIPAAITGTTVICSGASAIYSVATVAGATSYAWTLPGGWSGTSTTDSITATAGASGGSITVTAGNSCGNSAAQTIAVLVNTVPTSPGTITGTTTICSGSSNIYSIADVPDATGYTWTLPGGWAGTSATDSITTTASDTSGAITVTADNACGNSTAQTLSIVVNTVPAIPVITGPVSICTGNTAIYSVIEDPDATGYTWTLPGSWSGASSTDSITVTTSTIGGSILVTADNSCGSSITQTLAVIIDTLPPVPGTITGATTICSGSSAIYSVAAVAGAISYTWTLPGGWAGTSTTDSITTIASDTSGTISVVVSNGCGSSAPQTLAVLVNTVPAMPGTITGTATICSGSSNIYSIADVTDATGYTWTLPGGWAGTSVVDSIITTASDTSGTISVTADNSCGSSIAQILTIVVNTVPVSPVITGPATVCSGNSATYSVATEAGVTGYTWTLPAGWAGASTTDSITIATIDTSGMVSVTADNACGSSIAQTLNVTVDSIPGVPGAITGATTICSGSSNTYSIATVPGATNYTWTLPGGWAGTSTVDSIVTIASDTSGTITVAVGNSCGNSSTQTLTVSVNPLPIVSYVQSPSTVCVDNTSLPLAGASPAGGTFNGTAVTGSTFDASTAGVGTYTITYTYTDPNSCTDTANSTITVDACIGVQEVLTETEISLYPNPTTSTATLSGVELSAQLTVYNSLGKVVLTRVITEDKTLIDLSQEASEVYLLKIVTSKGIVIKRIVKQ